MGRVTRNASSGDPDDRKTNTQTTTQTREEDKQNGTIWAAKDRTTGKDYVIVSNVVTSVINESTSNTLLGIFNSDKEDKIYCHTFWGSVQGPRDHKTFGTRRFRINLASEDFLQEFYIIHTTLLILSTDFLTKNEITLDNKQGVLSWKPSVGAAEIQLFLDLIC